MSRPGLLRKTLNGLVDTVMRRETVGYDKIGNKYFRQVVRPNLTKGLRKKTRSWCSCCAGGMSPRMGSGWSEGRWTGKEITGIGD